MKQLILVGIFFLLVACSPDIENMHEYDVEYAPIGTCSPVRAQVFNRYSDSITVFTAGGSEQVKVWRLIRTDRPCSGVDAYYDGRCY